MSRLVAVMLLMFVFAHAPAQQRLGKAPFRKSRSVPALAHALTDGLEDDSLKLRSIYLWVTRHIRYDVKQLEKGEFRGYSPQTVLKKRRGICQDYCRLFDTLCYLAGLHSRTVTGYTLSPLSDPGDSLFHAHHCWSAVQIRGNWKLLDITWASGNVCLRWRKLRPLLSLVRIRLPFRLKYYRERKDYYFLTQPDEFVKEHLPSDPAWQMLAAPVPPDSFSRGPRAVRAFLKKHPDQPGGFHDTLQQLMTLPQYRFEVSSGKRAVRYNPANHFELAYAFHGWSIGLLKSSEYESLSDRAKIRFLRHDSIVADSALRNYYIVFNENIREKNYRLGRNDAKYETAKDFVSGMRAFHKEVTAKMKNESEKALAESRRRQKLAGQWSKLAEDYAGVNFSVRPSVTQPSEKELVTAIEDSIARNRRVIDGNALSLPGLNQQLYEKFSAEAEIRLERAIGRCDSIYGRNILMLVARRLGADDFDSILIALRDSAIADRNYTLALLKQNSSCLEWNGVDENTRREDLVTQLLNDGNESLSQLLRLKSLSADDRKEDERFAALSSELMACCNSMAAGYRAEADDLLVYAGACRQLGELHKRLGGQYKRQLQVEAERHSLAAAQISGEARAYAGVIRKDGSSCKKIMAYDRKLIGQLERKLKKEARTSN